MTSTRNGRKRYFYPRSPCGERPGFPLSIQFRKEISIHALLAESDIVLLLFAFHVKNFYPRSPCGERLTIREPAQQNKIISIHALLAESDLWVLRKVPLLGIFLSTLSLRRATGRITSNGTKKFNFYPRSPCGERQDCNTHIEHLLIFLSTLSLRRATPGRIWSTALA